MGGTPHRAIEGGEEPKEMGNNYSDDFKKAMVEEMSGPNGKGANALAEEVGLHQSTLSRWRVEYGKFRSTGGGMSEKKQPQNWTAEQKMRAPCVRIDVACSEEEGGGGNPPPRDRGGRGA